MSLLDTNNYFSITDILVKEERIQCETQQVLPKLGFLCAASKKDDLEPGTKLDFPLWLAEALRSGRVPMISCEVPKIYKSSYREILQADACAVDLNKWNQHYYELGLQLPQTSHDDAQKLPEFLLEVFKNRFRSTMDWEQNSIATSVLRGQLSALERKLLLQGNNDRLQLINWLNKGVKHIKTSSVLHNIKKRKRLNI